MIGLRILCLAIGYAFGCFQTAYILGKLKGIDIRNYGSNDKAFAYTHHRFAADDDDDSTVYPALFLGFKIK